MQFPLSHMPQCIGAVKTVPYRIPCNPHLSYHYLLALIFRQAIHQPAVHIIKHFFAVGFVVQLMAGIVHRFRSSGPVHRHRPAWPRLCARPRRNHQQGPPLPAISSTGRSLSDILCPCLRLLTWSQGGQHLAVGRRGKWEGAQRVCIVCLYHFRVAAEPGVGRSGIRNAVAIGRPYSA